MFDANSDGIITNTELLAYLNQKRRNLNWASIMMHEMDRDASVTINFPEFLQTGTRILQAENDDDNIARAFNVSDSNCEGVLSAKELGVLLASSRQPVNKKSVEKLLKLGDADGDGKLNPKEFRKIIHD